MLPQALLQIGALHQEVRGLNLFRTSIGLLGTSIGRGLGGKTYADVAQLWTGSSQVTMVQMGLLMCIPMYSSPLTSLTQASFS